MIEGSYDLKELFEVEHIVPFQEIIFIGFGQLLEGSYQFQEVVGDVSIKILHNVLVFLNLRVSQLDDLLDEAEVDKGRPLFLKRRELEVLNGFPEKPLLPSECALFAKENCDTQL